MKNNNLSGHIPPMDRSDGFPVTFIMKDIELPILHNNDHIPLPKTSYGISIRQEKDIKSI